MLNCATPLPFNEPARHRILLVEDDAAVREVILEILGHAGYRCTSVSSSQAALSLSDRDLSQIDLLVTDVLVPGLDGPALSQQLRRRHPGLQVLLISAWLRPGETRLPVDQLLPKSNCGLTSPALRSAPDATGMDLLAKPFGFHDLLERVRQAMKA